MTQITLKHHILTYFGQKITFHLVLANLIFGAGILQNDEKLKVLKFSRNHLILSKVTQITLKWHIVTYFAQKIQAMSLYFACFSFVFS